MKKIILVGRTGCGKTSLTQALRGEHIHYHKTQYVNYFDVVIDTPGEYAETARLQGRLPCIPMKRRWWGCCCPPPSPIPCTRPTSPVWRTGVIGIVTQIDQPLARPERAERWLRLAGCKTIFFVSAQTGEGTRSCWNIFGNQETKCRGKKKNREKGKHLIKIKQKTTFKCRFVLTFRKKHGTI